MAYTIQIPKVMAVSFQYNPATINQKVVVSVTIVEITKTLEPEWFFSGDIYSGEGE